MLAPSNGVKSCGNIIPLGSPPNPREFNTSRANKTVKDTSPVDLVYMPPFSALEALSSSPSAGNIPMISGVDYIDESSQTPSMPMKPQIYVVSEMASDMAPSPMSEVVDNHSVDIDPFKLTEVVGKSRHGELQRKATAAGSRKHEQGVFGQLWTGILDDLIEPQRSSSILRHSH
jgi:hypothetical protein